MDTMVRKMLGQYILEKRAAIKLTQVDLAAQLGFSPQFMGRIEKGEVCIPNDALIKAVNVLDLDASKVRKIYTYSASCFVDDIFNSAKKERRHRTRKTS